MTDSVLVVSGMSCENCVRHVTEAVDEVVLRTAIENAGYSVSG
jgi:copper chaperone CopZ